MLLTIQLRNGIEEYAGLLEQYGFQDEADYFRLMMIGIPKTLTSKPAYKDELLALLKLRRECYDIPPEDPVLAGFLTIQSQKNPTAQ